MKSGAAWILAIAALACACAEPGRPAHDAGSGALQADGGGPTWVEAVRTSRYLTMRDGTRIALDLILPAGLPAGERLPTVLHQTRYWRAVELRWPLSAWAGDPPDARTDRFVRYGYAVVSVDVRGSGASFGWRPHPWSELEQRDAAEIVAWIVAQPWSNGRVGSDGESYDGTAAELVAVRHPAVRGAAPRYALYDGYLQMPFPGGVPQRGVLEAWSEANAYLDGGALPPQAGWKNRLLVRSVRPADPDRALLEAAIRDHARNPDVSRIAASGAFRDDTTGDFSVARFSPQARLAQFRAAGVPLYSWSGWYDGALAWAAVERFRSVRTRGSRLLLGPWSHGGRFSGSPTSPGASRFDHGAELRRFFDPLLRDVGAGAGDAAPVHYYTLVEDRWKSVPDWPPAARPQVHHLAPAGRLERTPPTAPRAVDVYDVDFEAATGEESRWDSVFTAGAVRYPDRARRDARLLTYTAAPLDADLEVTGHPWVVLYVASSADDGAFFAYLEDVSPDGSVTYVTEGMLRGIHRKLAPGPSPLANDLPHHSYTRADALPLVPGAVAELRFDLLPVSYRFRRGHAIRLALAGADRDHFLRIPAEGEVRWEVHRGRDRESRLVLPVVDHGSSGKRTPVSSSETSHSRAASARSRERAEDPTFVGWPQVSNMRSGPM